jgi:predicted DNA-binding protein (MmcQ/YjbR family)
MHLDEIRDYCLAKKGVEETLPFGPDLLVFKVMGKMFLLLPLTSEDVRFNIKCKPDIAVELREMYSFVEPGYHMNKKHWNTIIASKTGNKALLKKWIDDSWYLVVETLPKHIREELNK